MSVKCTSTEKCITYSDQTWSDTAGKHALLVEFEWVAEYPNVLPKINLDIFFNRDISPAIKESVISAVNEEAEQYLGMSMTFSLVEYLKENFDTLMADQVSTLSCLLTGARPDTPTEW